MASALESNENSWMDFCERHAQAAAQDFSKSCMQYMNINLQDNACSSISSKDFLKKYLETFTEQFEIDFNKRRLHNTKITNGVGSKNEDESADTEDGSPKLHHKPFFRRFVLF